MLGTDLQSDFVSFLLLLHWIDLHSFLCSDIYFLFLNFVRKT